MRSRRFTNVLVLLLLLIGSKSGFSAVASHTSGLQNSQDLDLKKIQPDSFESRVCTIHLFAHSNNQEGFLLEISETETEKEKEDEDEVLLSNQHKSLHYFSSHFCFSCAGLSSLNLSNKQNYFPPLFGTPSRLLVLFQVFRI
ncbi:MAG: hypothetical protein KJ941_13200 [Bacteroidetes bacterium]|nr:hypothetical protein [Bacteroidota bacterium]